jgi:hypothetical protein
VFKRFEPANLFQISCADAVERFQLSLYLGLIILQEGASATLLSSALFIWLAEMVVDSVKHSFVSKFNRLHVDLYTTFTAIVAHDYVSVRGRIKTSLDPTHACVRRLGLSPLPLCCVLLRVTLTNVHPSWFPRAVTSATGFWALAQMLLCLALIKLALSMVLLAFSGSVINTQRGRLVAAAQRAQLAALHNTSSPTHATQPASGSSKRPETLHAMDPTSASSKHIALAQSIPNARVHLVTGAGGQRGAVAPGAAQSFAATPAVTPATELKPDFAARYLLADAGHRAAGCSLDSDGVDLEPCAFQLPVTGPGQMSQLPSEVSDPQSGVRVAPEQARASEEASASLLYGSRPSAGRQGQHNLQSRLLTAASPTLLATPLLRAEQSRLAARMIAAPGTLGRQLSSSLGMDTPGLLSTVMTTSSPALMPVDRSQLGANRIDGGEGARASLQYRGRAREASEGGHTCNRGAAGLPIRQPALMRMSTTGSEHEELDAESNARSGDGRDAAESPRHAARTSMAALLHSAAGRSEPTLSADARRRVGVAASGHFSQPVSEAVTVNQHGTTRALASGHAVRDDDIEALELMQQMLGVERYSSYNGKAIPL